MEGEGRSGRAAVLEVTFYFCCPSLHFICSLTLPTSVSVAQFLAWPLGGALGQPHPSSGCPSTSVAQSGAQ